MRAFAWLLTLSLLLAGCGIASKSKSTANMAPISGDGTYVASWPAVDVEPTPQGLIAVLGGEINQFPQGWPAVLVINRWNGVVGAHKDETRLLTSNGQVVASDTYDLDGKTAPMRDAKFSQMALDVLDISRLLPGIYTVAIYLDGREYARYQIAIVGQSASSPQRANPR